MSKQLKVVVSGNGRPVIFLHGVISTHRYWDDVVNKLSKTAKLIRPDLLGFGDSPRQKNADYGIDTQIGWLKETTKGYMKDRPILVGHSLGAIIALKWANQKTTFPNLVLTSIPILDKATLRAQITSLSKNEPILNKVKNERIAFKALSYASLMPKRVARRIMKTVPSHVAEDTTRHDRKALRHVFSNVVFSDEVANLLSEISVPTTVIVSTNDPISNVQLLKKQAKCNRYINVVTVDCSHQIPIDKPDMVANMIKGIIDADDRQKG